MRCVVDQNVNSVVATTVVEPNEVRSGFFGKHRPSRHKPPPHRNVLPLSSSSVSVSGNVSPTSPSTSPFGSGRLLPSTTMSCQPAPSSSSSSLSPCQQRLKPTGFRLGKRKILLDRRKRISDYALFCAVVGILAMVVETELTMANVYQKESFYSMLLKMLVTLSTFALLLLITIYHSLQAQIFVVDNCVDDWRIAVSWRFLVQFLAELVVCAIHPIPGSVHLTWQSVHSDGETVSTAQVPLDLLLSLPMFLRLYLICRVMLLHSRLFTDATSRSIGALNRISFDTRFIFKTLMTICPGTVLLVFTLTVWILVSWTLRACESYHDLRHRNFLNSMWMIAITFLSIGYGDIVPNTYCGRSIAVFTGVLGSGCTALVVAVIARKLELTKAEKHVHNFMMDNQLTKQLKEAAANVLRETWFIYKYSKLVRNESLARVRCHQRKFLHSVCRLRRIKSKQRQLIDSTNTLVDMAKHFIHSTLDSAQSAYISQPPALYRQTQANLYEVLQEMTTRQSSMELRTETIEERLRWLQTQIDSLPGVISQVIALHESGE